MNVALQVTVILSSEELCFPVRKLDKKTIHIANKMKITHETGNFTK